MDVDRLLPFNKYLLTTYFVLVWELHDSNGYHLLSAYLCPNSSEVLDLLI